MGASVRPNKEASVDRIEAQIIAYENIFLIFFFLNYGRDVYTEFMWKDTTINPESYSETQEVYAKLWKARDVES